MLSADVGTTTVLTLFELEGQVPVKTGRWGQVDLCWLCDCWWRDKLKGISMHFFVAHLDMLTWEVTKKEKSERKKG